MTASMPPARRCLSVLGLFALLVLALPALASAAYNPVGSGSTKLTFARSFLKELRADGVKLAAVGPAKLTAGSFTLPVVSGQFDPVAAKGNVEAEGALKLSAGGRSLPLKSWKLKTTQAHAPFSVKVGGGQLKLASASKLTVTREGFGDLVTTSALRLSAKVAQRLGKKLRLPDAFRAGQLIGTATTTAEPTTVELAKAGRLEMTLDSSFASKLSGLFVAVNPVFAAEHLESPFTFPIEGGQIAPDAGAGTLESAGSLELIQQGGGQVFLREPWVELSTATTSLEVDAEPSPPLGGKAGRLPSLTMAPGTLTSEPVARTITDSGSTLSLSSASAQTLNEAFAAPQHRGEVFSAGEAFASLTFTATAQ